MKIRHIINIHFAIMTIFSSSLLQASNDHINEKLFKASKLVIRAKSEIIESTVHVAVVTENSSDDFSVGESKVIESSLFNNYIDAKHRAQGPNVVAVFEKYGGIDQLEKIPEEELRLADREDKKRILELYKLLQDEAGRLGLSSSLENQTLKFFYVGTAKLTVVESFKGELEAGDEFTMNWKVAYRVACPDLLPTGGECGWIFNVDVKKNATTSLGHGFTDLKKASEIAQQIKKM